MVQREKCAKRRHVSEADGGILREALFQIIRERLSPGGIA